MSLDFLVRVQQQSFLCLVRTPRSLPLSQLKETLRLLEPEAPPTSFEPSEEDTVSDLFEQNRRVELGGTIFEMLRSYPNTCHHPRLLWVETKTEPRLEELQRRLELRFDQSSAASLGGFEARKLNIRQAMVAALLEHNSLSLEQMRETLLKAGVQLAHGNKSLMAAWRKKLPILRDEEDERFRLDRDGPEFLEQLKRMKSARQPRSFLVKRMPLRFARLNGSPLDLVLVVEEPGGQVAASLPTPRRDSPKVLVGAVAEAIKYRGLPQQLVVDDPKAAAVLEEHFPVPLEERRSLPELEQPYHTVDLAMGGPELLYPSLPPEELRDFFETAARFYRLAPWLLIKEDQLIEVRDLTRQPLYLSVLGYRDPFYGLGVVADRQEAGRLLAGDPEIRPKMFLNFLDAHEAFSLFPWLAEEELPVLEKDAVPFCFGDSGPASAESYQLMTRILKTVLELQSIGQKGQHQTELARVRWPADLAYGAGLETRPKLGRNDPCWCGSGKKYKKCHLQLDSANAGR